MGGHGKIAEAYWALDRLRNGVRRQLMLNLPARPKPRDPWPVSLSVQALPRLAAEMDDQGRSILTWAELAAILQPEEGAVVEDLIAQAARAGSDGNDWSKLSLDAIYTQTPRVFRLGLATGILDIVEGYMREPCLYIGPSLKCEKVDGRVDGNRFWHVDVEDRQMCRVLIYLNEVTPGGGPFTYVTAESSGRARASGGYRSGYLIDEAFESLTQPGDATSFYGGPGDAIVFDGTRVLHRAQPPTATHRYSLTLSYVTRKPLELRLRTRLSRANELELRRSLDPRQASCLPRGRMI